MLLLTLTSRTAFALVDVPALTTRVTDLTGTLSAQEQSALESKLAAFETQKGSQIAVLLVPTTEPEDIAQYSIRVAEQWKLGRKKTDDGVLVLIAKNDRKMRIEVGYGLEGAIPDVYAKRIVSDVMRPHFKQNDFYGGIDASVDALISIVNGEALPAPEAQGSGGRMGGENMLPLFLFGTIFLTLFFQRIFGRFFGSAATGAVMGGATALFAALASGIGVGVVAFLVSLIIPSIFSGNGGGMRRGGGYYGGGSSGSDWSSGSSSSSWGGGGGGDFGGGGASGGW
ncbi:MAG: YgcG family protein [Methylophilaceae bacterium]